MQPSHRPRSTAYRLGVAAVVGAALAVMISGCGGTGSAVPSPSPSADASVEPIFASDEEALAAAVKAYEAYSAVSERVAMDAGIQPDRVDATVTPGFGAVVRTEFAALERAGVAMTGTIKSSNPRLASSTFDETGASVSIYFCRDVSEVRVIASDGSDITPVDRDLISPTQAFFESSPDDPSVLLVDGVQLWPGDDFC